MGHRAIHHAGQAHVDAVDGLAQHLGAQVDARHGLADVAQLGVRLERRRLLRHGQRLGCGHDLTIGAAHSRISLDGRRSPARPTVSSTGRPSWRAPSWRSIWRTVGARLAQGLVEGGDGVAGAGADRDRPGPARWPRCNTSRCSQAASSSSAAACARAVCTPWPISTLGRKRRTRVVRHDLEPGAWVRRVDADRRTARRLQVLGDLQAGIGQAQPRAAPPRRLRRSRRPR